MQSGDDANIRNGRGSSHGQSRTVANLREMSSGGARYLTSSCISVRAFSCVGGTELSRWWTCSCVGGWTNAVILVCAFSLCGWYGQRRREKYIQSSHFTVRTIHLFKVFLWIIFILFICSVTSKLPLDIKLRPIMPCV